MSKLKIDIKKIIEFYDCSKNENCHISSVTGVAGEELCLGLLCDYFVRKNHIVAVESTSCTTAGSRLDAWIKVVNQIGSQPLFYQTEIKNWSMHSYKGGRKILPLNSRPKDYEQYSLKVWNSYWDLSKKCFKQGTLNKVLKRMDQHELEHVKPLACLWRTMHPEGKKYALFRVACNSADFKNVTVFSASTYLRNLLQDGVTHRVLHMPKAYYRINTLNGLFGNIAPKSACEGRS